MALLILKDFTSYSLVLSCTDYHSNAFSTKTLWILARKRTLDQKTITRLLNLAKSKGISTSDFKLTKQVCNN